MAGVNCTTRHSVMNSEKAKNEMENMSKMYICIFGGTTEGRLIAEFLSENNIEADLYIATEYGGQFVKNFKHINVNKRRLDENEMINLFKNKKYDYVIDATHPYAVAASKNIRASTAACEAKYIRVIREPLKNDNCKYFDNISDIVDYMKDKTENILLTTGSKDLDKFLNINNYYERIYVRILPMEDSLKRAVSLGYCNKNIICMQGPFDEDMNRAMIKHTGAKYVISKDTSDTGGFSEKAAACEKTGAELLVIRKPEEKGLTVEALRKFISEKECN